MYNPVFMTKQKFPKANIQLIDTAQNFGGGNVPCFSQLGQVTAKIWPQNQDFKRVLDLLRTMY